MRYRWIKCGYPTSMHSHWRAPWIQGRSICGMKTPSRQGWNLVDFDPQMPMCKRCTRARSYWREFGDSIVRKDWLPIIRRVAPHA